MRVRMHETEFSPREREVMHLLLEGKSNKQIALALRIANRTVEYHLGNIYAKLGVSSRTEAVLRLARHQLQQSTGEAAPSDEGIPQLKDERHGTSVRKVYYHARRWRRNPMKSFVRIIVFVLIAILLITLVIVGFALLRQKPDALAIAFLPFVNVGY
jgi:DNA-binding CsgD family transcriptional regulator